jgi:hypothetical protein
MGRIQVDLMWRFFPQLEDIILDLKLSLMEKKRGRRTTEEIQMAVLAQLFA